MSNNNPAQEWKKMEQRRWIVSQNFCQTNLESEDTTC